MPSPQLPNYLRASRRRLNLYQRELTMLLGKRRVGDIVRYEKSENLPNLETALAYEAIFKIPVSELFGGLYQKIESEVAERKKLLAAMRKSKPSETVSRKREWKIQS